MTLALITDDYPPTFSGVGDYSFCLAQGIKSLGVEVHIITRLQENVNATDTIHPIITGWQTSDFDSLLSTLKILEPNAVLFQFGAYAFHPYGFPFQLPTLINKIKKIAPTAIFYHEIHGRKKPWAFKRWLNVTLQQIVIKRLHRLADVSITSIPLYAKQLEVQYSKPARIIRIGSNIPNFSLPEVEKKELLKKLKLEGKYIIGTFGHTPRGIHEIMSALPYLKAHIPNLVFLLIGNVPTRVQVHIDQWINTTNPKSYFIQTGMLSQKEVALHLSLFDTYLMLEKINTNDEWTGTGTRSGTLATAMMLGLPIIGTRGDKTDSFLTHGHNIYLLDTLNSDTLLTAIKTLKSDVALRKHLSDNAKISHHNELSWKAIARQHISLLETL